MTNEFVVMNEPVPFRRSSGYYAKYHNAWYEAIIRDGDQPVGLRAKGEIPAGLGFEPTVVADEYVCDVDREHLDELIEVDALCKWRDEVYGICAVNEEVVVIMPGYRVDEARLKTLGFVETYGSGSLDRQVPITEVSDIREEITNLLHQNL